MRKHASTGFGHCALPKGDIHQPSRSHWLQWAISLKQKQTQHRLPHRASLLWLRAFPYILWWIIKSCEPPHTGWGHSCGFICKQHHFILIYANSQTGSIHHCPHLWEKKVKSRTAESGLDENEIEIISRSPENSSLLWQLCTQHELISWDSEVKNNICWIL